MTGVNFRFGSILTVGDRAETLRSRHRGPAGLNGEFSAAP